jgi:AraC family transcriptional regulator
MEWSERMNAAIGYIEDNLAGEINFNEAAKLACCSLFHFQRMFFAIIGITPAEYARRRRLTLAARELSSNNSKIIDIALNYGYDSPDSFTRAFRNIHGVTPQAARQPGVTLTAFPRVSFHIELKGGIDMDYRIIEKPAFEVIGKSKIISSEIGKNLEVSPEVWYKFLKDCWQEHRREKHDEQLKKISGGKPGKITGAAYLGTTIIENGMNGFSYTIGVEKPSKTVPEGFDLLRIPAATWAVFESIGPLPKAILDIEAKVFQEWFLSTGYEHDSKPELEVYLPGDTNSKDYRCEYWMPVVKKKK